MAYNDYFEAYYPDEEEAGRQSDRAQREHEMSEQAGDDYCNGYYQD